MVARSAPVQLLEHASRGAMLDDGEWSSLIGAWLDGAATDAQMTSVLARAEVLGLGPGAQAQIVEELVTRGDRLDLTPLGPSGTALAGAVGDPIELVVPGIAAALGVSTCVVAVRGRGRVLGSIDKLESVFGVRVLLPAAEVAESVRDAGAAVVGPGGRFAPGVARLEGLVEQTGLGRAGGVAGPALAARVLVSGARAAVVGVGIGAGGLVARTEDARSVRALLETVAGDWGRTVEVVDEDAATPAGQAVGCALELGAAGAVVSGGGDPALRDRAIGYAAALAEAAQAVAPGEGRSRAEQAIDGGRALASAERWLEAQGGDPSVWTDPGKLPQAPERRELPAAAGGRLDGIDAGLVGEVARWVGAGRLHASQAVDPAAGIELLAQPGQEVTRGEPLAVVHCRDAWQAAEAVRMLDAAFRIASQADQGGPA